ncbi:NAD(P)H-hydrate dehydratase [Psychrobacter sp.]|uniref:NAD(P)H-hydrate dehydratase n=1 Tax=Psychrobacter sp. TaxID=56811 RepID=UPI0025F2EA38|nr:NAD(P)H-hydrate dehydratase [Psychrobacter sp.]
MTLNTQFTQDCIALAANNYIALYTPEQVYAIEKSWFDQGNMSYALMQQAAWQIAHWIIHNITAKRFKKLDDKGLLQVSEACDLTVCVWVGSGNNGGDGWLVAYYLSKLVAKVTVIEVAQASTADAKMAKEQALQGDIAVYQFSNKAVSKINGDNAIAQADLYVDAIFGIGLDREPTNEYAQAIATINNHQRLYSDRLKVLSIDVPSGLVSRTGQVFNRSAVKADITLCLVARKLGLHIKDAADYCGQIIDLSLIPSVLNIPPVAWLQSHAKPLVERENNTHKGSFGHALIIGGNQIDGSQGMGGAALLSASTAFATGVGKLTVACHKAFHSSLIGYVPNAMSLDLHSIEAVKDLISQCDAIAIGMGLGRDELSLNLFEPYLQQALQQNKDLIIDADGLYHLATLNKKSPEIVKQLANHAERHEVWYTPHSGEAARLLNKKVSEVEDDRYKALSELQHKYQGSWLLKGAGSMVMTAQASYVCAAGNAGMATAGMGDVLSGLCVGLLAQSSLSKEVRSLTQAVMLHAMAGDKLQSIKGTWALQANDMAQMVGEVFKDLTID